MSSRWLGVVEACRGGRARCLEALKRFMDEVCIESGACRGRRAGPGYEWIEAIIERGVPDGRSRLILYVISRYLLNVKGLSPEEAEAVVDSFIEASCRNHGNCGKIYKSWIRHVLRRVKEGGWKPWSLERIKRDDPELYDIVARVAGLESG